MTPLRPWLVRATAASLLLVSGLLWATEIDTAASHIGFTMKTRWGQSLDGNFPNYHGKVVERSDGHHQVRLQLETRTVEIVGHPTYTRFARGSGFFDADDWPEVEFVSEPYIPALLRDGGELAGQLTMRGVAHREVFEIQPAACARAGYDCDAVATGRIERSDYGMSRWGFALSGEVLFLLRIRMLPDAGR